MKQCKTWRERIRDMEYTGNELAFGVGPCKTSPTVLCMLDEIRELRQAIEQAEKVEPVRWLYEAGTPGGFFQEISDKRKTGNYLDPACWEETPLYTHPPTAQAQQPLTDEKIKSEFGKLYPKDLPLIELAENNRDFRMDAIGAHHHLTAFNLGVKAAEAAHGIKGETK